MFQNTAEAANLIDSENGQLGFRLLMLGKMPEPTPPTTRRMRNHRQATGIRERIAVLIVDVSQVEQLVRTAAMCEKHGDGFHHAATQRRCENKAK